MQFLCIGYYDAAKMDALPKPEIDAIMGECMAALKPFHATGQVLIDAGLDLEARQLRRRAGRVEVAHGRYLENAPMIGSVFIVEAADLDDAIRIASLHPSQQVDAGEGFGWVVEIRPVHTFMQPVPI